MSETYNGRNFKLAYGNLSPDAQRIMRHVEGLIESHALDRDAEPFNPERFQLGKEAVLVLQDVTDYAVEINDIPEESR